MPQPQHAPHDLLELDSLLSDEARMVRDTMRRWTVQRVVPHIAEWFAKGMLPRELTLELGELGLLGMHLEGYGCAGASAMAYGVACRELEAADTGLRSLVSVQGSLAMFPIWRYGSEDQREQWLPRMARGEAVGCFALTEPDHGSDPARMRTRALRRGLDWVLNGTKMWITNGSVADVAVVWAQTEDGIRGFLVPRGTKGFSARDMHGKLSMRASITSELAFDDCRLPADAVLPEVKGMRGPLSCLSEARFGIIWGAVGAARACFETALDYSKTRLQFDRPIAAFQLTQRKLVGMMLKVEHAQLVALRLAELKSAGELHPSAVSIGKLANVQAALDVAREARTILGANGITLDYPVMRHMTNLESVLTYEGTPEMHTLILGEVLTGERAFV